MVVGLTAPASAQPGADVAADGELTLFLAGDTIITQPWSSDRDPRFLAIADQIRGADAAVVNLEMLFHEYRGHAQADSGGTYMAARPGIAAELAWAGVDLVAHANNHSFDYGSIGVLETLDSAARAGLGLAGSGRDLQAARAPAYFRHPDGTVALVATATSFVPYGKASRSRPDLHGRPGLNPLASEANWHLELPPAAARALWGAAELAGVPRRRLDEAWFELLGLPVRAGERPGWRKGRRLDPKDLAGNLAAVRAAAAAADLVVFSIHAHQQGPWLTELAHQVVDAGADVFFAHGPHRVLGIELYKGRPILYGLGDFVFQQEQIERFPSELYDRYELGDDATVADLRAAIRASGPRAERESWEGLVAVLRFRAGALGEIRLLPVDLGFGEPLPGRGRPRYADPALGGRILDRVREASLPYGTEVRHLGDENAGVVGPD